MFAPLPRPIQPWLRLIVTPMLWVMRKQRAKAGNPDRVIAEFAERQHGVVARGQLLRSGVSAKAINGRVARGQLRVLHRGVFQLGPIAAARAREMAAHLACGPDSLVSHRSAAVLWQLLPAPEQPQPIEILMRARERRRPGIVVRRTVTLHKNEVAKLDGIPLTTVVRTIFDLAATASAREVEQAIAQALSQRLASRAQLERKLEGYGGRGAARLRALLDGEAALTRSQAEERLLGLIRKAKLPQPGTNVRIAGLEVDFLWRDARLVVEVDGYAFHADAVAFEKDRQRDLALTSIGLRVVRITWKQLVQEPEAVLVRLAQSLVHR